MSTQTKVGLTATLLIIVVSFAAGRYSVRQPDTTSHTDVEKQTEEHKVTIIEETPQGKKTTITEDKNTQLEKKTDKEVKAVKASLNVSALGGVDGMNNFKPVFGVSVSKELIGPVTMGLWGITNGTIGVSLGVNF